ncbi:MAG: 1-deoxy-D-xylulose-5-phosphate reductoisomerase [Oscillospiraceae bacterium]|nr:1-deoxy-D-xylulose-5-phosphate reductoisomerase [Oscillospiraceae bacterium]MBQ8595566.1 1-deoxy-D-xylulose-5-phosphate reductoisomerase [Oscillospiraceae bacterium]
MKRLSILGSTGSIGTQALDVCRNLGYSVVALAAGTNAELLEKQAREFKPKLVALYDEKAAKGLSIALSDTDITVLGGEEGVLKAAEIECDIVLNAVTGIAGLRPTITAIEAGNDVALANKETLVAGGKRVMDYAKEHDVKILPVDSEHSAIFQCLQAKGDYARIQKLILTASGGPFFGKNAAELEKMKPEDALNHPTWNMGRKVTIDSATMANKGLEIIEAAHLFGVPQNNIEVVIHRESIVHSLVEFTDNSVLAQLGVPDMRTPIQYALTVPERCESIVEHLDLAKIGTLHFFAQDNLAFPATDIARRALSIGKTATAAFNAADEIAVAAFLEGKIGFTDIPKILEQTVEKNFSNGDSFEEVFETDKEARKFASSLIK